LDYKSLCRIASTCKHLSLLAQEETLWARLCDENIRFPFHDFKPVDRTYRWLLKAFKVSSP